MIADTILMEGIIRGIATGGYIAVALIILRADRSIVVALGATYFVCRSAHVIGQFPPAVTAMGGWYHLVDIPSIAAAPLSWLFVTEYFADNRNFNPLKLAVPVLIIGIGVAAKVLPAQDARVLWLISNFINVGLFAHITATVVDSWRGDLVEERRLAVAPLFLINVIYGVSVAIDQSVDLFNFAPREPSILSAIVLMLISWLSIWIFGRATPGLFKIAKRKPHVEPHKAIVPLPEADAVLVENLNQLMREERLYRFENLRISTLATRLGVTEHRLRKVLNGNLGYRNFSAYLGHWRLGEVKEALIDPSQVEVPISTIALDSGFQSLAPFNRAFKEDTGLTPTIFRRRALESTGLSADGDEADQDNDHGK